MMTSTEVGKRLGVHANTIRTWSDRYKPHLSAGAVSGNRLYTDDDYRVLATVAHYRQLGISLDDVAGILADGKRVDDLPPEPSPDDDAARAAVQLVPKDQLFRALDEVKRLEDERLKLITERDLAVERRDRDVTTYNERINTLEREIGELRGKLNERQSTRFWLLVLGAAVLLAIVVTALLLLAA